MCLFCEDTKTKKDKKEKEAALRLHGVKSQHQKSSRDKWLLLSFILKGELE